MVVKAKKILASELMYAKGMDEDEAAAWLDDELGGPPARIRGGAAVAAS
jgi:RNA polymerase-interacting CarD/CdnL/TRCF family regulator